MALNALSKKYSKKYVVKDVLQAIGLEQKTTIEKKLRCVLVEAEIIIKTQPLVEDSVGQYWRWSIHEINKKDDEASSSTKLLPTTCWNESQRMYLPNISVRSKWRPETNQVRQVQVLKSCRIDLVRYTLINT